VRRSFVAFAVAGCAGHAGASDPRPQAAEAVAAPLVDAFTNSSPVLAPDGRVVFVSSRDGLPQLYVGESAHPERAPLRLPVPNQRTLGPALMPDGKTALFISDVSSDEKFHLFKIGLDGSGLADLTPTGELHRSRPLVARRAGTIIYSGHAMADQTALVFVQTLDGTPREVYRDPQVGYVSSITADGDRALFVRSISHTDQILFALDIASGAATRLFPPDGEHVAFGAAVFTADGASVIVGSEAAHRPPRVLRIDARTGAEQARYVEPTAVTASIDSVAVPPNGGSLILDLDAGDHSELRTLDPRDLHALAPPKFPLAALDLGSFTPDGGKLALSIRSPQAPPDVAVLDAATGLIAPLRDEPRKGLGTPPHASIETARAFDGRTLPMNVYLPAGVTGKLPTLVLVHGGPSSSAKIAWSATIAFWSAMGFAVVAPNIRGSTGFGIDYEQADDRDKRGDAVKDIETVNRWARAQPWCDGDRIVIGGISYGGYMTLLALTRQPTLWRAGIDGSGMSNLKTMEELEDQTIRAFDDTEFGVLGKDDALLVEWSPLTAVDKIVAPVFVYQGVHDPVTPQHEADQIVEALRRRNVPVEYMLVENEGHGVTRRENLIAYLARSYRFVAAHMGLR
jgi:dienelactone hydrolase